MPLALCKFNRNLYTFVRLENHCDYENHDFAYCKKIVNFAVEIFFVFNQNNVTMPIDSNLYSKTDILQQIPLIFNEVSQAIEGVSEELFTAHPIEGKWSIAENFDHLIKSGAPVASGLKMNKLMLRALGKPNRSARTYEGLVKRYREKLGEGGVAGGEFLPNNSDDFHKGEMLKNWKMVKEKLMERTEKKWSEKDLDDYLMPHPLLGKLLVREMLFFTIFHTGHHLKAIERLANV